jgi:hypothetical protein
LLVLLLTPADRERILWQLLLLLLLAPADRESLWPLLLLLVSTVPQATVQVFHAVRPYHHLREQALRESVSLN